MLTATTIGTGLAEQRVAMWETCRWRLSEDVENHLPNAGMVGCSGGPRNLIHKSLESDA